MTLTISIAEYVFSYAQKKYDAKTLEGKKGIMEMFLPQIKFLHPVEVDGWVQKLSSLIGVRQDLIIDELKKIVIDTGQPVESTPQKLTRSDSAMQDLLTMLLKKYLGLALFLKDNEAVQSVAEYGEIFQSIIESVLQQETTEETEMLALQGAYDAQQHENVKGELEFLLHEIKKEHLRKKIKSFVEIMKVANLDETDTMLEEIRGLTNQLEKLEKQQPWQ